MISLCLPSLPKATKHIENFQINFLFSFHQGTTDYFLLKDLGWRIRYCCCVVISPLTTRIQVGNRCGLPAAQSEANCLFCENWTVVGSNLIGWGNEVGAEEVGAEVVVAAAAVAVAVEEGRRYTQCKSRVFSKSVLLNHHSVMV